MWNGCFYQSGNRTPLDLLLEGSVRYTEQVCAWEGGEGLEAASDRQFLLSMSHLTHLSLPFRGTPSLP